MTDEPAMSLGDDVAVRQTLEALEAWCEGHPAGPYDHMGQTTYCDGSCRSRTVAAIASSADLSEERTQAALEQAVRDGLVKHGAAEWRLATADDVDQHGLPHDRLSITTVIEHDLKVDR